MQELWFPFPGAVAKLNSSKLKFVPLVTTGDRTGMIPSDQLRMILGDPNLRGKIEAENSTGDVYTLAAHITGEVADAAKPDADKAGDDKKDADKKAADKSDASKSGSAAAEAAAKSRAARLSHPLNVVLVMDIDLMEANVFGIRSRTDEDEIGVHFDNIVFVANALDSLAGDDRFIEIRKRKPEHRTLTTIDNKVSQYRAEVADLRKKDTKKYNAQVKDAEDEGAKTEREFQDLQKQVSDLQRQGQDIPEDLQVRIAQAMVRNAVDQASLKSRLDKLGRDHQHDLEVLDRQLNTNVREEQNWYKFLAVLLPPIPPIIVAIFVFFSRRAQEREGVARSRLR